MTLLAVAASSSATAASGPFDISAIATTPASSCSATDGMVTLTIDAANQGTSPYDISLDNGATWVVNNTAPNGAGEISVSGQSWGTYTLAVRDATAEIVHPGYAQVMGCTKSIGAFSNPIFSSVAVSGATGYSWSTTIGSITAGQNTLSATFDFSSEANNASGSICVQPTGPTYTAPPTCFDFIVVTVETDCSDGIDNDGDGLIDCADPDCYLASNSGATDNDGDGIGDPCDLDDDNDGIPDDEECQSGSSISSSTISGSQFGISNIYTNNMCSSGSFAASDIIDFEIVDNGSSYTVGTVEIVIAEQVSGVYTTVRTLFLEDFLNINNHVIVNDNVDLVRVRFNPTSSSGENYNLSFERSCGNCRDTDGDGIDDYLDLDSDNDGIYDVDEAGHSAADANNDGVIDGAPATFGFNGLFDALETVADNGTLNYSIANSETTPDGIFDAYELDSDGDGCLDATEESVNDSDSDGIAGTGIPTVDANGLVTSITYSIPSNNTWQNYSYVALACDTDNDLINPIVDIDDDNDGIPDLDECDQSINLLFAGATVYLNGSPISSQTTLSVNDVLFFSGLGTLIDGTAVDGVIQIESITNNADYDPATAGFGISPFNASADDNFTFKLFLIEAGTFNIIPFQGRIEFLDVDSQLGADFTEVLGIRQPHNVVLGSNIQPMNFQNGGGPLNYIFYGLDQSATGATGDWVDEINATDTEMDYWISSVFSGTTVLDLAFGVTGTSGNRVSRREIVLSNFYLTDLCDFDGDGIVNTLDLDSDNDGIFDVDEAGHAAADANNDGIIDGVPSTFGVNGLFDALETVADNGTINYGIADSESTPDGTYDAYELDSDGDLCLDASEEGVSDSDNDGIAGAGVPTVNANGLVPSITYVAPPNSIWQNPALSACNLITGTVFEDINYGGGSGRSFATANTSAQSSGWSNLDVGIENTRVELYGSSGAFIEAVDTDATGVYTFSNVAPGNYEVRFATRTASSNRGSNSTGQTAYAVPTFRSVGATAITNQVGGADPTKEDAASNTTNANLSTLNTVSTVAQAVSSVTVGGSNIANVDLGLSFNVVTNTNTSGIGSLHQFLLNSNELDNVNIDLEDDPSGRVSLAKPAGKDVSIFEIPGVGPHVLTISAQLPIITDEYTHLTGYTQQGSALGDNDSRTIQVEITGATNTIDAVRCTFDHFEMSGIAFHGFRKVIYSSFSGGTDIHLWGNYFGLQSDGTAGIAGGNGFGIQLNQSAGAFIGTDGDGSNDANEGNIISNTRMGVFAENSSNLLIAGNWIGIEADGATAAPNTIHGIEIDLATGQNIIGFDDTKMQTNGAFFRNVISGNASNGIRIDRSNDVRVSGNYIGTNASGTGAVPNDRGIRIIDGCSDILIGTDSDGNGDIAERNIISGNGTAVNGGGIWIDYTGANVRNIIAGNYIGTDVTGMLAVPNLEYGVHSLRFNDFTVVGTNADGVRDVVERNVVSGNTGAGIIIREQENAIVAGNYVGVAADGVTPLGNGGDGVIIVGTDTDNTSVGCGAGFVNTDLAQIGNIIQNNGGTGLHVTTGVLSNNCLRNNIFGNNGELGIDLAAKGVDPNDQGDVDTGPNDLYNIPIIESSTLNGNLLTVKGYTRASSTVDFYIADAGPSPNPLPAGYTTSFGEGVFILGSLVEGSADDLDSGTGSYTDDGTGNTDVKTENRFEFTFDVSGSGLLAFDRITAIATPSVAPFSTSGFSGITTVGSLEDCLDGIDNDLDGLIDCFDPDCGCGSIAGRIYEDINYGGGLGRSYSEANTSAISSGWATGAIGVASARVELYSATGDFVASTTTDGGGNYDFSGLAYGNFIVRAVSGTVISNRTKNMTGSSHLSVQTYRTDGVTATTAEIGGADPQKIDAVSNTTSASLASMSNVNEAPLSLTSVSVNGGLTAIDFGFNFNTVVNTNTSGQGSLRQFILNSNELNNTNLDQEDNPSGRPVLAKAAGEDVSIFEISGAGPHVISLSSVLPDVEDAHTHISGYTQQGAVQGSPQARTITIGINGVSDAFDGLRLDANNLTVSGLAMYNFQSPINMIRSGATNTHVWGNFIGLQADGTTAGTNATTGIYVFQQASAVVGTNGDGLNDLNEGNVVANSYEGINLRASANVLVAGNYVGLNRTGTASAGNQFYGIFIRDCPSRNVIGLDDNLPSLTALAARNVSSGNGTDGLRLFNSSNQVVAGNYLGTNSLGTAAIANAGFGLQLLSTVSNNQIGTDSDNARDTEEGNLISGNGTGMRFNVGSTGTNNWIAGNYIGTDATGNTALPNSTHGIVLDGSQTNTVIGTNGDGVRDAIEGNIISGNADDGIRIGNSNGNLIAGNNIGVGADGTSGVPNQGRGIIITGTAANNIIGYAPSMTNSDAAEVGNLIRGNGDSGIAFTTSAGNNRMSRNSYGGNTGLAIDLGYDLVTINDNGDGDNGPNQLLNYPVLSYSKVDATTLRLKGYAPAGSTIELYVADAGPNPSPLPAGYTTSFGEGMSFLGTMVEGSGSDNDAATGTYTDDGSGAVSVKTEQQFMFDLPLASVGSTINIGDRLTAICIDASGNTSEFGGVMSARFIEICTDFIDNDGDGLIDCDDDDCPNVGVVNTVAN